MGTGKRWAHCCPPRSLDNQELFYLGTVRPYPGGLDPNLKKITDFWGGGEHALALAQTTIIWYFVQLYEQSWHSERKNPIRL